MPNGLLFFQSELKILLFSVAFLTSISLKNIPLKCSMWFCVEWCNKRNFIFVDSQPFAIECVSAHTLPFFGYVFNFLFGRTFDSIINLGCKTHDFNEFSIVVEWQTLTRDSVNRWMTSTVNMRRLTSRTLDGEYSTEWTIHQWCHWNSCHRFIFRRPLLLMLLLNVCWRATGKFTVHGDSWINHG